MEFLTTIAGLSNYKLIIFCAFPQIVICLMWVIVGKPRVIKNLEARVGTIVLECSAASAVWPTSVLTYIGLLMAFFMYINSKARKNSSANNELRFFRFCLFFKIMIIIAFVPAYNSTYGRFKVATEIFSVIAMMYGYLACIFLPKCYLIFGKSK